MEISIKSECKKNASSFQGKNLDFVYLTDEFGSSKKIYIKNCDDKETEFKFIFEAQTLFVEAEYIKS